MSYQSRKIAWIVVLAAIGATANADLFSIKLTTNALGLGTTDLNAGSTVNANMGTRFYTSGTLGEGSVLNVQMNGLAGTIDQVVTITSRTHLDTLYGLPPSHDYQAGVLYISKENTGSPDGRDEGIGVRAFTVDAAGRRLLSGGLAKIEGSKDVSGGTGPIHYEPGSPNGAPHVDEDVTFTFDPLKSVLATSVVATVTKFASTDVIDLTVNTREGHTYNQLINTSMTGFFTSLGSDTYIVKLAGFGGLGSQTVGSFTIRAIDPNPANPRSTAEHFLISGIAGDASAVPGPAAMIVMGTNLLMLRLRRRKA